MAPVTEEQSSLGQRAAKGAAWLVIAQVVVNLLRLAGNLISARFLDRDDYGVMAIVVTVNVGLVMISDVGIEQSVIYDERGDEPRFLKTAFSLQVLRGLVLYAIALLLTYPMVWFYDQTQLLWLLPFVSLQVFFAGFNSMRFAWCKRKVTSMMQLALIEMGTQLSAFSVIVILSWQTRSVWALAIGTVVYAFARMALTHLLLKGPKDGFAWDKEAASGIFTYGRWIFVSTFVTFFSLRFDVFALGRLSDMDTLGLYNMALMLSSLLNVIGFQVTQNVLFPALSEAGRSNDPSILKKTFQNSQRIVLAVGLWAVCGLIYLGPPFFHFAYREQFAGAGWLLQLQMSFTAIVFVTDSYTRALMAVNDNRSMAVAQMVRLAGDFAFCIAGYNLFGIEGFILGMGLASLSAHIWVLISLSKNGLPAARLDGIYLLIALPLAALGIFGPAYLAPMLGVEEMIANIVLALIVGLPFTAGLGIFLARNVQAARHAAHAETSDVMEKNNEKQEHEAKDSGGINAVVVLWGILAVLGLVASGYLGMKAGKKATAPEPAKVPAVVAQAPHAPEPPPPPKPPAQKPKLLKPVPRIPPTAPVPPKPMLPPDAGTVDIGAAVVDAGSVAEDAGPADTGATVVDAGAAPVVTATTAAKAVAPTETATTAAKTAAKVKPTLTSTSVKLAPTAKPATTATTAAAKAATAMPATEVVTATVAPKATVPQKLVPTATVSSDGVTAEVTLTATTATSTTP